jgi:outer membrane protein
MSLVLVALLFTQCDKGAATSTSVATSGLKLAYVNVDSLLANYEVYKKFTEEFIAERQQSEMKLASKMQDLQKDAASFQDKMQKGFYSRKQAESIQKELVQKEQKLRQLQADLGGQLQQKQFNMRSKMMTKIDSLLKVYSKEKNLDFVISKPMFAKEQFDITKDITKMLNEAK